ncbi:MAG TPA: alkaline phosphatase family protein [Candidatus Baltobacteraceae bacterium]
MTIPRWLVLAALLTGCSGGISPLAPRASLPAAGLAPNATTKIQHVVILIQENRSFDNLFATFVGADGTTHGQIHTGVTVPLAKRNLLDLRDVPHGYYNFLTDYDKGKLDGFDVSATQQGVPALQPYQYVDPAQIAVYWTLARRYVLADHMFTTQGSDSFTAHQDLIAGGTQISPKYSIVDPPNGFPWGCDASAGTVTSLVTVNGTPGWNKGPFPCFNYPTLAGLLDRKKLTWRYYATFPQTNWNAFEAIRSVRYGARWSTNISTPQNTILNDIFGGTLPAVSWVIPTADYSDHPGEPRDFGPDWIGSIVNAVGKSAYWKSTAIVIVWDDWGGFYDHVQPPPLTFGGLGFRVPAIIVSPYARAHYVAHQQYEFGSILRFIEDNWKLGRLGTSDTRAASIGSVFNFSQKPRAYVPVKVAHDAKFFLSLPPSTRPLDSE